MKDSFDLVPRCPRCSGPLRAGVDGYWPDHRGDECSRWWATNRTWSSDPVNVTLDPICPRCKQALALVVFDGTDYITHHAAYCQWFLADQEEKRRSAEEAKRKARNAPWCRCGSHVGHKPPIYDWCQR